MEVSNIEPFSVGTPILIGEIGQADAEILKVYSISGNTITFGTSNNIATTTAHAHPESTKIVALQFDQIRFFWTALLGTIADETPTFNDSTPLTAWTSLDPTSYYSTYADADHSTGHGWFMYKEALTGETSQESNPIPYSGFGLNTVATVFADVDSGLNTNELRLISINDKFSWINEALSLVMMKLNLTNAEVFVSAPQTITTVSGTAESILPDDFSDIVEITDNAGTPIDYIPVSQVMANNGNNPSTPKYYLRGRYIGFSPTPTSSGTLYKYTYRSKAVRVTNLSTLIILPDNAFYSLKSWMLYKAYLKAQNPLATTMFQEFKNTMDLYTQASVKRSAALDTWDISPSSNT